MTEDIRLRAASAQDAQLLADMHRESFPNYWDVDAFNDFFGVMNTLALVAEAPEAAGMIVYRIVQEQADIITIAVRPGYRRRGVARLLLLSAMENAALQGAKKLFLDVEDGNVPAIQLYEKQGFTAIRRRKLYYRQSDGSYTDALVMMGKLA